MLVRLGKLVAGLGEVEDAPPAIGEGEETQKRDGDGSRAQAELDGGVLIAGPALAQGQQGLLVRLHPGHDDARLVHQRLAAQHPLDVLRRNRPDRRAVAQVPLQHLRPQSDDRFQPRDGCLLNGIVGGGPPELGDGDGDLGERRTIGLQEFWPPGQEIAALAGLGVLDQGQHRGDAVLDLERMVHPGLGPLLLAGQPDRRDAADDEHGEARQQRRQRPVRAARVHRRCLQPAAAASERHRIPWSPLDSSRVSSLRQGAPSSPLARFRDSP